MQKVTLPEISHNLLDNGFQYKIKFKETVVYKQWNLYGNCHYNLLLKRNLILIVIFNIILLYLKQYKYVGGK